MKTKRITLACICIIWLSFCLSAFAAGGGQVNYDLGVFALDEGNLAAAEKHFSEAIRLEPDNPYYHHYLGKTYLATNRVQEAIGALEAAWELNPDIRELQYDLAMANYEASNYAKAEELFSDLVARDPGNVLARYYLGMAYFRQDSYGKALPPLLSAGEENESIRDNSFYFAGISHYKFDEPEKALEKLAYVESQSTSDELRHSARKWQEVIREQQAKSAPYNLYLKLGLVFDDNVTLDPLDIDFVANEEDLAATAYFSGKYKFINTLKRKVGIGYTHYQILYEDLTNFDMTAGIASLFFQERLTPEWYLSFNYLPGHYWVDDQHYLRRHQLSPSVLYRLDQSKGLRLGYDFIDNDYLTDKGRSGQAYDIKLDFITMLFNKNGDLTVGVMYENNDSDHPDHEYGMYRAHIEFSYVMPMEWKFAVKGIWSRKDFDNIDSTYGIRRSDDRYSAALELSRSVFFEWLKVQAEYSYTRNESDINDFSYKKNVMGLSLIAQF